MLRTTTATVCVYLLAASHLQASLGMFGGEHTLLPDQPDQAISITLTGMSGDPKIVGANIVAQILSGPLFQSKTGDPTGAADFNSGTIWTPSHDVTGFAPISGAPEFVTASVTLDDVNFAVDPNGVVVNLLVDTSGIHSGTYDLLLKNDALGFTSNVILAGGVELVPEIHDGTITVSAVPEPSAFSLLGLVSGIGVGAMWVVRRYRRSSDVSSAA